MISETYSYGRAVSMIHRHMSAYINAELKDTGIRFGHALFIRNIQMNPGCSQKDLCERLLVDKTTTAKHVKKLESMGLIFREKNDRDQRLYQVYLTETGQQLAEQVFAVFKKTTQILKRDMDEFQQSQVEGLLRQMQKNICQENGGICDENCLK